MAQLTITVPDQLLARVVAGLRAQYPDLTAGKTDAEAAQAVIKFVVRSAVSTYEAREVAGQQESAESEARKKAWADTESIT